MVNKDLKSSTLLKSTIKKMSHGQRQQRMYTGKHPKTLLPTASNIFQKNNAFLAIGIFFFFFILDFKSVEDELL